VSPRRTSRQTNIPASRAGRESKLKIRQQNVEAGAIPAAELAAAFPDI